MIQRIIVCVCCGIAEWAWGLPLQILSPDGAVQTSLTVGDTGQLVYAATFHNKSVVYPSPLGLTLDGCDLGQVSEVSVLRMREERVRYSARGASVEAELYANRALYYVKPKLGAAYGLQIIVSNEGFAWRFLVTGKGARRVNAEMACWRLPLESRVWLAETGQWRSGLLNAYREVWMNGVAQALPLVAELPNNAGYAVVTEVAGAPYGVLQITLEQEGLVRGGLIESQGFELKDIVQTPWRVVMLASTLEALVNNAFVGNLASPPDPALFDTDDNWLKGGRSVWNRTMMGADDKVGERAKLMIDEAATLTFEFMTIDEGWATWPRMWETLREVCAYGRTKKVRVFVWADAQPLNQPQEDFAGLRGFLDQLKQVGVAGVKVDGKCNVSFATRVFETRFLHEAALRKLLVNMHGFQVPAGESRTYANEMTRGNESYNHQVAANNAALPFTRGVVGHTDYMPLTFPDSGATTWAHQLAMAYLVTSPLLVMTESPQRLREVPQLEAIIPFVKEMPVTWDETHVLVGSRIGELAAFARRKGRVWYVTMVNGTTGLKLVSCPLSFTGWQRIRVTQFADVRNQTAAFTHSTKQVKGDAVLIVSLESQGGFVARLEQEDAILIH